jgi:3-hydroxyisobutyrate dehydrogenase-like beta-hydroxyacid dehydrogenase
MEEIGFIGTGVMGAPMAIRLMKAGYKVTSHDIDLTKAQKVIAEGARFVSDPKELIQMCSRIISMLPLPSITEELFLKNGLAQEITDGKILLDMSTSEPTITVKLWERIKSVGGRLLDAPVSGGEKAAKEGTLTIMVGGDKKSFDICLPIFQVLGEKIFFVGEHGAGHTIKLINNMIFAGVMSVTAEGLVLGERVGLDMKVMREVMNQSSAHSYAMDYKVNDFVIPRDFTPGFSVTLQKKDLDLALSFGRKLGIPLILANIVNQLYEVLIVKDEGQKDTSYIITLFEELMGLPK